MAAHSPDTNQQSTLRIIHFVMFAPRVTFCRRFHFGLHLTTTTNTQSRLVILTVGRVRGRRPADHIGPRPIRYHPKLQHQCF